MSKSLQLYPLVYPDDPDPSAFKAGTGWLKRFKDRHGVRALSVQGKSLSAAADTVEPFKEQLCKLIEDETLTLNQVFNCDGLLMQTATKKVKNQKQTKLTEYFSPSTYTCNTN